MEVYKNKNEMVWYDAELLSAPAALCTNAPYWYIQNTVIGTAKGRGTTWFIQLNNIQGALRHYRRGGLFGKFVQDRYFFTKWDKTRSYQEFILLKRLREAGVNVPIPIAASVTKGVFCYRADLLSEKIPNASDLVDILQNNSLDKTLYIKIGQEIWKMHNIGVNHTDLNIHNILLDDEQKVWIIDFDKCYQIKGVQQESEEWKRRNLERLKRSFQKEKNKRKIHWKENEWHALMEGYSSLQCVK